MRSLHTLLLAAIVGVVIESVLGVISVVSILFGGIGPCGPTDDVPIAVTMIHQPGFWISGALVEDSSLLYLPLGVALTTVFLSVPAFVILKFLMRGRNPSA